MEESDNERKTQPRIALTVPDVTLPEYEVGEQVGAGGMALVYRAIHKPLDREVALKVLLPEYSQDPSFAERFMREARIAGRLVHPHIVQIYDVDQYESDLYLAMEYVKGGDLTDKISKGLSAKVMMQAMEELCDALDFAHSEGYIHRDIKPANILFRGDGSLVLSDFGIARSIRASTQLTQAGLVLGTPTYMSPEQAEGKELTAASDLYSVGVLMFELITGLAPYRSSSSIEILHQHLSAPIPSLPKTLPHLQVFFNRALAKDPSKRYSSGKKMIESLRLAFDFADDLIGIRKQFTQHITKISKPRANAENKTVLRTYDETMVDTGSDHSEPVDSGGDDSALESQDQTSEYNKDESENSLKFFTNKIKAYNVAGKYWLSGGILLVIFLAVASAVIIDPEKREGDTLSANKIKGIDPEYINKVIDRAYGNYIQSTELKLQLDSRVSRKMALGNTGDLDVDSIINETIKDDYSGYERLLDLIVNDLAEIDLYRSYSPAKVDRILAKQEKDASGSGDTTRRQWLSGIREVFANSQVDEVARKSEMERFLKKGVF